MANGYGSLMAVLEDEDNVPALNRALERHFWHTHKGLDALVGWQSEYGATVRPWSYYDQWQEWVADDFVGSYLDRPTEFGVRPPERLGKAAEGGVRGQGPHEVTVSRDAAGARSATRAELRLRPRRNRAGAALRQGRYLRYGCKHGGCGTCRALLVDGEVDEAGSTFALPSSERAQGWVLLCASVPLEPCTIDVSAMELTEENLLSGDSVGDFTAKVEDVRRLTPDINGLRLRLVEPASMRFVAGQFVNVEVPGTSVVRAFSMANPPPTTGTSTWSSACCLVAPSLNWSRRPSRPGTGCGCTARWANSRCGSRTVPW